MLASLKNTLDEVRVQVYPKNETEKKVSIDVPWVFICLFICCHRCMKPCPQRTGAHPQLS
jgi:hypothetical protein